jgi:carotenoid cleavage dioxygenase
MSRYHEGIYAPVERELTETQLRVEGAIPPELRGVYLRNGPNPATAPDPRQHWFSGDGMVHGVRLEDGRAKWYRNRWVRTASLASRTDLEAPAEAERNGGSPSNTNVIGHAGRLFALCEPDSFPVELSPELDTLGPCDFGGSLARGTTAHPKTDPATGELHVCGYDVLAPPYLTYHVIAADGSSARSIPIDLPRSTMAHDFAITERHVLFLDLPVRFDLAAAQGGDGFPFTFQPETGARVGVMPRDGGSDDVVWFEVEPCYVFHPMNAYDDGDRVVIDVARYPRLHATGQPAAGPLDEGGTTLDRWTLDLAGGSTKEQRLDERAIEFPRVDERRTGHRYRYGYATQLRGRDGLHVDPAGIIKYDLDSGRSDVHRLPDGSAAGEPVFVPAAGEAAEDEGWLITYVHDGDRGSADLVVLDATRLASGPVARVEIPARIPIGFHGNWIPDAWPLTRGTTLG